MTVDFRKDKVFRLCDNVGSGGTPDSSNPDYYDGAIRWVQTGDLNDGLLSQTEKTITNQGLGSSSAKVYPAGTLLIAMYGATIGKMSILESFAATNQACCAMNFRSIMDTKYMFYKFLDIREPLIAQGYGGGQQNISQEIIKQTYIFFPRIEEQRRIAAYLDKTCAAIDTAIEKKQKQLEALDALRKSIIHKVVTRGLDDSVELKDSGIEWIGRVPIKWQSFRIKDVAQLSPRFSNGKPGLTELCAIIPMEAVSEQGKIDISSIEEFDFITTGLTNFEVGDVIFAKITPCMENGKGAYVKALPTRYAFGSTEFHVLRPGFRVNGKFLYYYTYNSFFRDYAEVNMTGAAGQKRVSSRFLNYSRIYLPLIGEQKQIVEYLDSKIAMLHVLQENLSNQISALEQYRKSLIHECVTGKRRIIEEDMRMVQQY